MQRCWYWLWHMPVGRTCCADARTSLAMSRCEYKSYGTANKTCLGNADRTPKTTGIQRCNKKASNNQWTEKMTHRVNHPALCLAVLPRTALSTLPFGNARFSRSESSAGSRQL